MIKVIHDNDWGGDALQVTTVLLGNEVELLGGTCCFGNTNHDQAFKNGRDILQFLNASHIPMFPGSKGPSDEAEVIEDGAHGSDGIGGVVLPASTVPVQKMHAVDFIIGQLKKHPDNSITIIASAAQTNIAKAIRKAPEVMRKVKQIIIMGGGVVDMPAHDMPLRRGNITPDAEFNFHCAPRDAHLVLNSGLPITLMPMNCTHGLTLTPARRKAIKRGIKDDIAETLISLMSAPAEFDRRKFNLDPVMHDVNCAVYLLAPELYETEEGVVSVLSEPYGRSEFTPLQGTNLKVAMRIKNSDALFDIFLQSVKKVLAS